jgi:hypothetical protein
MEMRFDVTGEERKRLVSAISEIVDLPANYLGTPTFAYEIGEFTVDREGTLFAVSSLDHELMDNLKAELAERGFEEEDSDRLVIEIPIDGFTDKALDNLNKLIASKASLIKKATGAKELSIIRTDTTLKFPWFRLTSRDETEAFTLFVEALCKTAKQRKRITAKERPVENEKFTFRVFLIQLGFVGDEYKAARKILLKNLPGNSAFRDGAPKEVETNG